MQKIENSKALELCLAVIMGVINGLFGAGGGMLAVILLERCSKLSTQRAHATALFIMLPLSLVSVAVYFLRGVLELEYLFFVTLGMLPGSLLGAKLLGKLKSVWVDRLFCLLMLFAGVRLVV